MIDDRYAPTRALCESVPFILRPALYVAIFVLTSALLVVAVRIPPILDFPNHFERIFLISGGIEQPFFHDAYALDWSRARTNIGIDLLAYWIGPLIGLELLARSLLFLAIVLPPIGAIALNRRIFGGEHPFHVAILFLAWSTTLIGGFINFQIGLGLALLFALVDLQIGRHRLILINLWRMVACFLLTLDHIFAAGFYLVLSAGLELPAQFHDFTDRRLLRASAKRITLAAAAGLVPIAGLVLSASGLPGDDQGNVFNWNTPLLALSNFLSAITSYFTPADVFLFVPIVVIIVEARSRRKIRFHAGLLVSVAFLLVLSMVAPRHAMGTGWISWRFPIMTLLAGAAAIRPFPDATGPTRRWFIAGAAAAVFVRTIVIALVWWQGAQDATAVQRVLAVLPPHRNVLPVGHFPEQWAGWRHASRYFFWGQDTIRHLPTLATSDAGAFVPTLFTAVGKQPLMVMGGFRDISVPEGNLVSVGALFCESLWSSYLPFTPYLANWRRRFDYVLVVNADLPDMYVGSNLPDGLVKIADAGFAALYAIDKTDTHPRFAQKAQCPAPQPSNDK
ncbi:hypothetical protein [Pleomorphomonas sp. PLEO]|uniref:hypothetical protein n=1 Tax=Pleomorphomonas sp. PLEO TaxID=3239306 RepID=UPI00351E30AE